MPSREKTSVSIRAPPPSFCPIFIQVRTTFSRLSGGFQRFSTVFGRLSGGFQAAHRTNQKWYKLFIMRFDPPLPVYNRYKKTNVFSRYGIPNF